MIQLQGKRQEPLQPSVICIKKALDDMLNEDITFVLDLTQKYFDIFVNGYRIGDNNKYTFENLKDGNYVPYIAVENLMAQMSMVGGIGLTSRVPGIFVQYFFQKEFFSKKFDITHVFLLLPDLCSESLNTCAHCL